MHWSFKYRAGILVIMHRSHKLNVPEAYSDVVSNFPFDRLNLLYMDRLNVLYMQVQSICVEYSSADLSGYGVWYQRVLRA